MFHSQASCLVFPFQISSPVGRPSTKLRGLSLALFIAVPVFFPGSLLGSVLGLSCVWCAVSLLWLPSTVCSLCGFPWLLLQVDFVLPLDFASRDTCMSTDQRLQDLELAVRSLSRVVDNLVAQISDIQRHLDFEPGYWALVCEEAPFGIPVDIPRGRFREFEEGPPEIPDSIWTYGSRLSDGPGADFRIRRAWSSGFWAVSARVCCTSYTPASSISLWDTIWVVIRARGISRPVTVSSWSEVQRLINLPGTAVDPIVQGFPTLSEARIFCAGGGIDCPAHLRWISRP